MEVNFRHTKKCLFTCTNFYTYISILSFYRLIVGSKESSVTKIITDATAGSDYDQVYKHNFDEDFSITPNKIERMEKLMTEHHATLLRTVASTTKHQLYQSCQVGNIGPNDTKSLYSNFFACLGKKIQSYWWIFLEC